MRILSNGIGTTDDDNNNDNNGQRERESGHFVLLVCIFSVCVFLSLLLPLLLLLGLFHWTRTKERMNMIKIKMYKEFHGSAKNFHKFTLSFWCEQALTLQAYGMNRIVNTFSSMLQCTTNILAAVCYFVQLFLYSHSAF